MENKDRRRRLDALRLRKAQGILTEAEREELEALFAALDAEEALAMRSAQERMEIRQADLKRERERLAAEAAQLERVLQEQQRLLDDARSYLEQFRAKRAALADEFHRIGKVELTRPQ